MEENPPLPEEAPEDKRRIAFMTEQIKLSGENKIEGDVLMKLPQQLNESEKKEK